MSLDWVTDEESYSQPPPTPPAPRPGRGRRWGWAALLLLLLLAGGLIYRQQWRQVQAQEASLKAELIASYQLRQQAIQTQDAELFALTLANQDPAWQVAQKRLFTLGLLTGRDTFNLAPLPNDPAGEIQVQLTPDWQAAELRAEQHYTTPGRQGQPQIVRLAQTTLYQRHGQRWLQTPPNALFWGETQTVRGTQVDVTFPARDATTVRQLQTDLEAAVAALCAGGTTPQPCPAGLRLTLHFDTDPNLLADLAGQATPLFRGQSYLLPTPTLVGQPLDDIAYQALFQGYTRPILDDLRNSLSPPIPLPTQDIVALCFPADGFAPQLAHYSPAGESWTNELPGRAFRYLLPRPGGDGIVLQEDLRGRDASDLRLLLWQPGRETLLFDGLNNQRLARPVAWGSPPANPHLIIQGTTTRAVAQRNWLDLNDCHSDGCRLVPLPAYAIWSNDGQQTILSQDGQMWRGSANGEPLALLGAGFSPFWLDAQTYGYTRYTAPAGVPIAEIVLATAGQDQPHTLLRATDLPDAAGTPFIDYVAANPARPGTLLAAGPILGSSPGRYNIYQITLDENLISSNPAGAVQQVTLAASLPDALRGHPALLTPTGYPPFDISPDGRWLLATMLHNPAGEATAYVATDPAGWTFFLHDLDQGATHQFTAGYPLYPGQYPYYDWSADGRWLLIGDDGYLRLVAPAYDYQRLLPHPYANCLFTAWLNPPAPPR